jgi:quercetin dioxygenase-like cupin family protein
MKKVAFVLSLALSATAAVAVANAGTGTATTLMVKELPDFPGKDGMVEVVDFAPGEVSQPHRHNADLFVYVLEGTIVTQVEGEAAKSLKAGDVFYESPTDVHVVAATPARPSPQNCSSSMSRIRARRRRCWCSTITNKAVVPAFQKPIVSADRRD